MSIHWDKSALERATNEAARKAMKIARDAAARARCPEHGVGGIRVTGLDREGGFEIAACCETGKEAALAAIRRALPS
jgi:hypothetical protein